MLASGDLYEVEIHDEHEQATTIWRMRNASGTGCDDGVDWKDKKKVHNGSSDILQSTLVEIQHLNNLNFYDVLDDHIAHSWTSLRNNDDKFN